MPSYRNPADAPSHFEVDGVCKSLGVLLRFLQRKSLLISCSLKLVFVKGGKILPAEYSVSMVVFDRSKQLSTMTCGKSGNERKPFCPRPNKARTTERKKVSVKYLKPLNFLYIWYNYFDQIRVQLYACTYMAIYVCMCCSHFYAFQAYHKIFVSCGK